MQLAIHIAHRTEMAVSPRVRVELHLLLSNYLPMNFVIDFVHDDDSRGYYVRPIVIQYQSPDPRKWATFHVYPIFGGWDVRCTAINGEVMTNLDSESLTDMIRAAMSQEVK